MKQRGFGLISTIVALAIAAAIGWLIFTRVTNVQSDESAPEAIDRATTNVDKANEASQRVQDAADSATDAIDQFDQN